MKRSSICAVALSCFLISVANAKEKKEITRGGDEVVIKAGEVIKGDLRIGAARVVIAGTVQGNVVIGGDEVEISGKITGDLEIGAAEVDISGVVGGDLEMGGGELTVSGTIGGSAILRVSAFVLEKGGAIGGDLSHNGSKMKLLGSVGGSMECRVAKAKIDCQVGGDVGIRSGKLVIGGNAVIKGLLDPGPGATPKISEKARVRVKE